MIRNIQRMIRNNDTVSPGGVGTHYNSIQFSPRCLSNTQSILADSIISSRTDFDVSLSLIGVKEINGFSLHLNPVHIHLPCVVAGSVDPVFFGKYFLTLREEWHRLILLHQLKR